MNVPTTDRCAQWTEQLQHMDIPVLRATISALDLWRTMPDRVDANSLADTILGDPLMTLRLLIHVAKKFDGRLATPVETVTGALVLMGIEPFFHDFSQLDALEDRLAHVPMVASGASQVIERSHRAARLAAAFAIYRQDPDAELLHQAALLDNFSGLLLCCEAPAMVVEIVRRQRDRLTLRSADVQRAVLGVELSALEHSLMTAWGLAEDLRDMMLPGRSQQPGARCVALAVRIARHSQKSWDNAALPDDYTALGRLLNIPIPAACALVREIADWNQDGQEIIWNSDVRPRVE